MERLIKRSYGLAAIVLAGGIFARAMVPDQSKRTEPWMENHSLKSFGKYKMAAFDDKDPSVTYKMSKDTYEALAADGIVCRLLTNGAESFDVVLIGSRAKSSFHDPRVCFTAQGWQLSDQQTAVVDTKTRGRVPMTVTQISSDQGKRWAAFFYRGPEGFSSSTDGLKLQMFKHSLLKARNSDGVFYRFIAGDADINKDQLLSFIGAYLDASKARYGDIF